ncbi:ABC transporter permease [Proteocatella sphenisci]|uniref:ABC transporter permease n=1 Tax=Proteocatella sphenisci TaxID=181070 RepID=UPI00048BF4DF|nr:ABC transporter permease subunit [Proteocatella sphenisci]
MNLNKDNQEKSKIVTIAAVSFWILLWQFASMAIGEEILLASPVKVLKTMAELFVQPHFWSAISGSMIRMTAGFAMACTLGIILSVLSYNKSIIRIALEPLMHVIKAIPVASFVILALVWIKTKNLSIFISFLMVLPIIYTNTLSGLANTDAKLLEMAKVFGISPFKKALYIYTPIVMPFFLSGATIGIAFCWKSGIAAEVIGLPGNSIGENLYQAKILLDTAELLAWTVTMIIISVIYEKTIIGIIKMISKKIERI